MPYKSDKQRKFFHVAEKRGEIAPETVKEWDEASKGKKMPETAKGELLDGAKPSEMDELVVPTKKPSLKPRKLSKEDLIMALDKSGYRESALCLKNWGEEDPMAAKLRKELEMQPISAL